MYPLLKLEIHFTGLEQDPVTVIEKVFHYEVQGECLYIRSDGEWDNGSIWLGDVAMISVTQMNVQ